MRIAEVCESLLREEGFPEEEKQRIRIGQFFHTPFFNIHEIQELIREVREASESALSALRNGLHLPDNLISYVEKQRRVEDRSEKNIEAILNCRKARSRQALETVTRRNRFPFLATAKSGFFAAAYLAAGNANLPVLISLSLSLNKKGVWIHAASRPDRMVPAGMPSIP